MVVGCGFCPAATSHDPYRLLLRRCTRLRRAEPLPLRRPGPVPRPVFPGRAGAALRRHSGPRIRARSRTPQGRPGPRPPRPPCRPPPRTAATAAMAPCRPAPPSRSASACPRPWPPWCRSAPRLVPRKPRAADVPVAALRGAGLAHAPPGTPAARVPLGAERLRLPADLGRLRRRRADRLPVAGRHQSVRPLRYIACWRRLSVVASASRPIAAPAWAWVMARPSASAASLPGRPGSCSSRRTISCTWDLAARPWPTTAFFICSAVYSATGSWLATRAVTQAPRAWPSSRVDWGFTFTKTISTVAASGW